MSSQAVYSQIRKSLEEASDADLINSTEKDVLYQYQTLLRLWKSEVEKQNNLLKLITPSTPEYKSLSPEIIEDIQHRFIEHLSLVQALNQKLEELESAEILQTIYKRKQSRITTIPKYIKSYTPPSPYTKKEKSRKNARLYAPFIILFAILAVLWFYPYLNSSPQIPSTVPTEANYPKVSAYNGQILIKPSYEGVCPFTLELSPDALGSSDYFFYLEFLSPCPYNAVPDTVVKNVKRGNSYDLREDSRTALRPQKITNREDNLGFFRNSRLDIEIDVPPGCYRLWYCTGETWYGLEHYFGNETMWFTSNDLLVFYLDDNNAYGHVVTLQPTPNGNFDTHEVSPSKLPPELQ